MKPEKKTETRKKLPYTAPRVVRVRLDPDGTVLTCNKATGHGT